ncbi:MAG: hypothetical protein IK012_04635 [Fibrobacter sp.]|uniref:hypothetical protein n=1 Tax=Fibrobacter sp. TaxID=35828 RepID=UPI0025C464F7|nr:hypothetical protein [Fibrobacter sp.]MBR4784525.1 hypothetical protein [Fibrobacter sp.]
MRTKFIVFLLSTLFVLSGTAAAHKCGMAFAYQNRKNAAANPKGFAAKRITIARAQQSCDADAYYDTVLTRETEHFQIFYTLDEGPHATIPEFIDSLAVALEDAFHFHTVTMGMRIPMGIDTTSHYQKPVKKGLYPIEVADIDFLRDPYNTLGSDYCHGCYGITFPDPSANGDHNKSGIIIDNDFHYVPKYSSREGSLVKDGKVCNYPLASEVQYNRAHGYSYADNWDKAIRVTAFHELYHAVQLRYTHLFEHWSHWIEASATANEEIGVPDVNDYFFYIPYFFNSMNEFPLYLVDTIAYGDYGESILYLYLYKHVDKHFDKEIWENFAKTPNISFEENLEKVLNKRNLSADSVFHDFATRLTLSGENANTVDKKLWVWDDQPNWESPRIRSANSNYSDSKEDYYYGKETSASNKFVPDTSLYSFRYYAGGEPDLENYRGRASVLLFNGNKTEIRRIANTGTIDSINRETFLADSILWVFSRFANPKSIPEVIKDSTLRAFPVPWRGSGMLCFTPLPDTKKFIEIRTGRGELVLREPYTKTTHCISEERIKEKMKPGVYRFRAGASGKLEKFLVVY